MRRIDRVSSCLLNAASQSAARPAARAFAAHAPRAGASISTARLAAPASRIASTSQVTSIASTRCLSTAAATTVEDFSEINSGESGESVDFDTAPLPSPHPDRASKSAKLAALRARLSLTQKLPLQVLARSLVDPSADSHPSFNNATLAYLGSAQLQHHIAEYLATRYPRLPMPLNFAAMKAYGGAESLHQVARSWGVEAAAAPGEEVDPGLLQFDSTKPSTHMASWGFARSESKELQKYKWRRGMSSRIMYDDPFGDMVPEKKAKSTPALLEHSLDTELDPLADVKSVTLQDAERAAHANFVRALLGAVYLYNGREAAKSFILNRILNRRLDLHNMFRFKQPARELARLCNREDFEAPVARLISETGRASRTPVFVVGIYSGREKLGEGTGASLDDARTAASINCLRSWYLYSPADATRLPSDTLDDDIPWTPVYIDMGEIIS